MSTNLTLTQNGEIHVSFHFHRLRASKQCQAHVATAKTFNCGGDDVAMLLVCIRWRREKHGFEKFPLDSMLKLHE